MLFMIKKDFLFPKISKMRYCNYILVLISYLILNTSTNATQLINKNENKRGIGKIGKILADEEIFYMGQLKKLGPEKLYEIVKHKGVDMERVQNFYFRKVPPNKFQKNKKDLPIGALRLSTRSWNALNSTGIEKISEIDIQNLDKISNLGVLSIKEITLKYLEFTQD